MSNQVDKIRDELANVGASYAKKPSQALRDKYASLKVDLDLSVATEAENARQAALDDITSKAKRLAELADEMEESRQRSTALATRHKEILDALTKVKQQQAQEAGLFTNLTKQTNGIRHFCEVNQVDFQNEESWLPVVTSAHKNALAKAQATAGQILI